MNQQILFIKLQEYGLKAAVAILIVVVGSQAIKYILKIMKKLLEKSKIEESYVRFVIPFLRVLLYSFLFIIVFEGLFNNSGTVLAILGSLGLALSLSFQNSLSNLASGILLLFARPFKVGDYIIGEKIEGKVEAISLIYTSLMTIDLKRITVPNSIIANNPITNVSASNYRRVEILVGISYGSDLKLAKEILHNLFMEHPNIVVNHLYEVQVNVKTLNTSSVDIRAYGYVLNENYWNTYYDILERIKLTFDENHIVIPFQTLNVTLNK